MGFQERPSSVDDDLRGIVCSYTQLLWTEDASDSVGDGPEYDFGCKSTEDTANYYGAESASFFFDSY